MMNESTFVVVTVLLLAFDGLVMPLARYGYRRDKWDRFVYSAIVVPVVFMALSSALIPHTMMAAVLLAVAGLFMGFNRWYISASDDELAEGVIWQLVRDVILDRMNRKDTDVHIQIE